MAGYPAVLLLFGGPFVAWYLGKFVSQYSVDVGVYVFFFGLILSIAFAIGLSISNLRQRSEGRVCAVIVLFVAVLVIIFLVLPTKKWKPNHRIEQTPPRGLTYP
jgi:peptidoglycan/LPS O-acetylase OafA/YrhL